MDIVYESILSFISYSSDASEYSIVSNSRGVRSLWIVGGQGIKINGIWSKVGGQKMKFSIVLAK